LSRFSAQNLMAWVWGSIFAALLLNLTMAGFGLPTSKTQNKPSWLAAPLQYFYRWNPLDSRLLFNTEFEVLPREN
jgi:hypothetical protein